VGLLSLLAHMPVTLNASAVLQGIWVCLELLCLIEKCFLFILLYLRMCNQTETLNTFFTLFRATSSNFIYMIVHGSTVIPEQIMQS